MREVRIPTEFWEAARREINSLGMIYRTSVVTTGIGTVSVCVVLDAYDAICLVGWLVDKNYSFEFIGL